MKHQEHIAAFENGKLSEILKLDEGFNKATSTLVNAFLKDTLPALVFTQRLALDDSSPNKVHTHKQILPYVLIKKHDGDGEVRYMVYQRGKGVGESRLAGNMSLGLGGHVDIADCISMDGVVDIPAMVRTNIIREIMEETHISSENEYEAVESMLDNSRIVGFINDTSDHVGRDHLGVAVLLDCTKSVVSIREAELKEIGWFTKEELVESKLPFENWSKILIDSI